METIHIYEIDGDIWEIKEAYFKNTNEGLFYYVFKNGEQQSILVKEFETESGAMYAILSEFEKPKP